ncbi:putative tryptophan transporter [Corynebacterium efficiens YS-314]|uniref:Putative tryptophan transporter n=2 Tax=Corynebacterium efficiens TaxID=152794 RepID=Q8FLK3_COREF|nr:putative tryptophan transporter [Corynebacterium efficiens YS-314]
MGRRRIVQVVHALGRVVTAYPDEVPADTRWEVPRELRRALGFVWWSNQPAATPVRLLHSAGTTYPENSSCATYQTVPNPPERITERNEPGVRVVDMTVIGIILGSLFGILAVLLVVTGVLAWKAKLPGNPVLGIRVPEVRKSQELWDMAHRVAGPLWVLSGVAWAIASLMAFAATGWMWLVVGLGVIGGLVFLGMGAGMGAHTVAMVDAKRKAQGEDAGGCSSCGEGGCGSAAEGAGDTCAPANEPVENDTPVNAPAIDFDALRRAAQAQNQAQTRASQD